MSKELKKDIIEERDKYKKILELIKERISNGIEEPEVGQVCEYIYQEICEIERIVNIGCD